MGNPPRPERSEEAARLSDSNAAANGDASGATDCANEHERSDQGSAVVRT